MLPDKHWKFWASSWTPWIGLVTVVLFFIAAHRSTANHRALRKENKKLRVELDAAVSSGDQLEEAQQAIGELNREHHQNLYDGSSDFLALLLNDRFKLDNTVRASLYLHDGSRFVLAGRHTADPIHCKVNRKYFKDDQGVIGVAWRSGREFVELPDTPGKKNKYLERKYNLTDSIIDNLRMDSCVYCGFAVDDGKSRIGVILFEATRKGVLDEMYLSQIFEGHKIYIADLLSRFRSAYERVRAGSEEQTNE
ncbi:hypothetical protein ACUNV4_28440 [Granulosicoccus sp. 3-233]|uniref:hypothetical protein n=1 Tax=Granulosicoccus sp. 3-233 TaxID=3417969 RepID=UPI003D3348AD